MHFMRRPRITSDMICSIRLQQLTIKIIMRHKKSDERQTLRLGLY
nr:MAG TPA: hypothetical protein [Caudoviricetes sp.]